MGLRNSLRSPLLSASLLISSIAVVLIVLPLFQKGCFMDGLIYQTVAYNYAIGESSFWNMKFTNTSMSYFCEQPPLYFYLSGNFFRIFGSGYPSDRIFTLLLMILSAWMGYFILKSVIKNPRALFLLFCFFLLCVPVICWSYANELIETLVN